MGYFLVNAYSTWDVDLSVVDEDTGVGGCFANSFGGVFAIREKISVIVCAIL